jgi:hypothetical protein
MKDHHSLIDADIDALQRCMEIARQDRLRAGQLDDKLSDEPWSAVARFASRVVQGRALKLKPWQEPPCCVSPEGPERDHAAQRLLRKMLAAGVSRYDPDPVAAIARAGASQEVADT